MGFHTMKVNEDKDGWIEDDRELMKEIRVGTSGSVFSLHIRDQRNYYCAYCRKYGCGQTSPNCSRRVIKPEERYNWHIAFGHEYGITGDYVASLEEAKAAAVEGMVKLCTELSAWARS